MQRLFATSLICLMAIGTLAMLNSTTLLANAGSTQAAAVSGLSSGTLVSTELINFYGMTSTETNQIISILHSQGISIVTIRFNAMSEFTSGSSSGISAAKRVISAAHAQGMLVNIDLHTWYTTWDNYFRDSASNRESYRSQYLSYVRNVISQFSDSDVFAWMVLNEPQARTASSSENQFILDIISTARQVTNRPISVRFMGGYSPDTGYYSRSIDDATDFLCRNVYWDPQNPTRSVYGVSQSVMNNMIANANQRGKALWITEFGKSKSDLNAQDSYIRGFVSYAKSAGIDGIYAWVTQNEGGSSETYNLFNGYTPYPAFYELTNSGSAQQTNPTPTPTPTPTQNPTPTSTSTNTPSPQLSYPTDTWQRLWFTENNAAFGAYLGEQDEPALQFDNNWSTGTVVFGQTDNVGFSSSRTVNLAAGEYSFSVGSDDGFRLWIDGKLVGEFWADRGYAADPFTATLASGLHKIRIDYYENLGAARATFSYQMLSTPTPTATSTPTPSDDGSSWYSRWHSSNWWYWR
jgi:hypothetical protein